MARAFEWSKDQTEKWTASQVSSAALKPTLFLCSQSDAKILPYLWQEVTPEEKKSETEKPYITLAQAHLGR